MAITLNNKLISIKERSKIIKYILANDVAFFNNAYFVPLDLFTCKGKEIIKIKKVQASLNLVAGAVSLVAFVFNGDVLLPPRGYGYPANILFPYSWPLAFSMDSEGALSVGNANTERIKAFCESGQTLVIGLYTDFGGGAFAASGIELEVEKGDVSDY